MSDLSKMKVRQLDFTLLMVLRDAVRFGKLSRVATELGVTQTAISHSVRRLRDIFDDELFIRRPHGVEPTQRALELAIAAGDILDQTELILSHGKPFDPAMDRFAIRIAALDYEVALLTRSLDRMLKKAPHLKLEFRGLDQRAALAALEAGDIDLWVGFARALRKTMLRTILFDETYTTIFRLDHPRLKPGQPIDLETFCTERHIVAAPGGTTGGIVDKALAKVGRKRHVSVNAPGFLSTLDAVANSDLIATVPTKLALFHAPSFRLALSDPPVTPRPFQVAATWHRRSNGDAKIPWFVDELKDALKP